MEAVNLYPAIDLFKGEVVRLSRGEYHEKKVYSSSPEAIAKNFEAQGAAWLHVIDLEGAKEGGIHNKKGLQAIRRAVNCKIQFGGGLRTMEALEEAVDLGVNRAILGTQAYQAAFLRNALDRYPSHLAVSLDAREGQIQTDGWLRGQGITVQEAVRYLNDFPLDVVIYTDIHKDGMMTGPNMKGLQEILDTSKAKVILSGGVAGLEDIKRCREIRHPQFEGVIIGRALYEKKFLLSEALQKL